MHENTDNYIEIVLKIEGFKEIKSQFCLLFICKSNRNSSLLLNNNYSEGARTVVFVVLIGKASVLEN